VGVHEYIGHFVGNSNTTEFQGGTAVEAKPAEPENEGTQGSHGQVCTRDCVDLTLGAVFPCTRTQYQHASKRRNRTGKVHNARACIVAVTQLIKAEHRLTTPRPASFHWIDESSHDDGKAEEGKELHALGHRAGDNGHGCCNKHHLEEEVRCT